MHLKFFNRQLLGFSFALCSSQRIVKRDPLRSLHAISDVSCFGPKLKLFELKSKGEIFFGRIASNEFGRQVNATVAHRSVVFFPRWC